MLSKRKKPFTRKCDWCGVSFATTRPNQIYCSSKCREDRITSKYEIKKLEMIPAICAYCGMEYLKQKNRTNQKYCSNDCARLAMFVARSHGRYLIFERDDFTCFYCGKKSYTDGAELHADHVTPTFAGGPDRADNLVTACKDCNLEKSAREIRNTEEIFIEIKRRNKAISIPDETIIKLAGSQDDDLEVT